MSNKKFGDEIPVAASILGKRVQIIGCAPCGVWLDKYPTIHDLPRVSAPSGARCVCVQIGRTVRIRRRQSSQTPDADTVPVRLEAFRLLPAEVKPLERKSLREWFRHLLSRPNPAFVLKEQAD